MGKKFRLLVMAMLVVGMSLGTYTIMAEETSLISLAEEIPLRVIVDEVKYIADEGKLSDIIIQERRVGCLTESRDKEARTLTLSLEGTRFKFSSLPKITLSDGYKGLESPKVEYFDSSQKVIGITLPYNRDAVSKGKMTLSGIGVEGLGASTGDVMLQIGTLLDDGDYAGIQVARIADYGVTLEAKKQYSIKAGGSQNVTFTVKEILPDSLTSGGTVEVSLNTGYFKANREGNIDHGEIYLNGIDITSKVELDSYDENGYIRSFEIRLPNLNASKVNTLTFSNFKVCAGFEESGIIDLTVAGRGVPEAVSTLLATIKQGNETNISSVNAAVGVKEQKGGSITLSEQDKGDLALGYIKLKFEGAPYVEYSKDPIIEVTSGDLEVSNLGWSEKEENTLILKVTKKSKRPSTLVIRDFTFSVNRMAPDGTYGVKISGSALSPVDETFEISYDYFMNVSADNGDIIDCPAASQFTKFTLGSKNYRVNDIICQMDAEPFAQDGRIMVPVRYVAVAAGTNDDDITYKDGVITIKGEKTIYLYLNSNVIMVNGQASTMVTEPVVKNQRMYVPVAEIARILNLQIDWDSQTQTATFVR